MVDRKDITRPGRSRIPDWEKGTGMVLAPGMVILGLATFAAMLGFITLCDRM